MQRRVGTVALVEGQPFARGGTATVWRGRHKPTGLPVALKALQARRRGDGATNRMILDEVLRAATLDHPSVLRVFDYGILDRDLHPELPAGTPYMVTEWADGGALRADPQGTCAWSELRELLEVLLGALAHIHARGLLHRDIKPANVLLCSDDSPRPGLKLADLGIAALMGSEAPPAHMATAGFAPPEQLDPHRAHEQGPWTDLYALGALATALLSGGAPLPDLTYQCPLPPDAPPSLHQWLAGLLAPAPLDRFRSAPAALAALDSLPDRPADALPPGRETIRSDMLTRPALPWPQPRLPDRPPTPPPAPPVDLRRAEQPLLSVRAPRLVGRHAALSVLWTELVAATAAGESRVAIVEGAQGVGRTRLVDELAWRAAEAAGVPSLRIRHSELPGDRTGLAVALRRALGVAGLQADQRQRFLLRRLARGEDPAAPSLASIEQVLAGGATARPARAAVLGWVLRALGAGGPVMLIVEDAEWAEDTWEVVETARTAGLLPPGLVVRVDIAQPVAAGPLQGESRDGPSGVDAALRVELAPLTTAEIEQVLTSAAPGRDDLCRTIVDQAHGHIQLARLLLARALGPATTLPEATLADDPLAPWRTALAELHHDQQAAVVIAAAAGLHVDRSTWRTLCADLGLNAQPDLLDRLVRCGFWTVAGRGLAFADPFALQATLELHGHDDLLARAHRACAALECRRDPVDHGRVGLHLAAAGDPLGAAPSLELGAEQALLRSDYAQAERLAGRLLGLLPEKDQGRASLLLARAAAGRGRHDEVEARCDALVWSSGTSPGLLAAALHYRAMAVRRGPKKDFVAAEALLRWAGAEAARADDRRLHGRILLESAALVRWQDPAEAVRRIEQSRSDFEAIEDRHGLADALAAEADVLVGTNGDLGRAEALLRDALVEYEAIGNAYGMARVRNSLGDILRKHGRLEAAQRAYAAARDGFHALGSPEASTAWANQVLLLLERREDRAVLSEVDALEPFVTKDISVLRPYLGLAAVTAAARLQDRTAFDAALATWLDGKLEVESDGQDLRPMLDQARAAAAVWSNGEDDDG